MAEYISLFWWGLFNHDEEVVVVNITEVKKMRISPCTFEPCMGDRRSSKLSFLLTKPPPGGWMWNTPLCGWSSWQQRPSPRHVNLQLKGELCPWNRKPVELPILPGHRHQLGHRAEQLEDELGEQLGKLGEQLDQLGELEHSGKLEHFGDQLELQQFRIYHAALGTSRKLGTCGLYFKLQSPIIFSC